MSAAVTPTQGVSVLFARSDSCYFELVSDVWDVRRDARNYSGLNPVVAHPPCRGWGRLRHLAKPRHDEKALALFAVEQVRRCGGVLEHPMGSSLWAAAGLPVPGERDSFGGWTLLVEQGWWGHPAPKPTYLYIVGCDRSAIGELPVQLRRAGGRTLALSPAEREKTPIEFARFLVRIAAMCSYTDLVCDASYVHPGARHSYTDLAVSSYVHRSRPSLSAADKRAAFKLWGAV